ncbi:MAG: ABC transporter ATP-binding protein [Oligoflexia bacterium]|nr:ABC transporter ATP-binding protein [Oligoflexia bacterium]
MATINNISIELNNVSKSFGNTSALRNFSINFHSSSMHVIVGPEGAGKTTLMRILAGLLPSYTGEIKYHYNIDQTTTTTTTTTIFNEIIRTETAYMSERQSLYPDLSIKEHLEFFRDLYSLNSNDYQQKSQELLAITRLDKFVDRSAQKLSGGMYKKLGLICSLLRSPQILLLDEPTNGVDPISRREFWELLYHLKEKKILIIVTTSYMDEAEKCSTSHLMQDGELLESGNPNELLNKHQMTDFNSLFIKLTKGLS